MIKRTAESLFWIGRYLERAENQMRLINVSYHTRNVLKEKDETGIWKKIIAELGDMTLFQKIYEDVNETSALQFLTFEQENPNSLFSCVNYIRNNVRAFRQLLPSELWDSINGFYLWFREENICKLMMQSPYLFYQRIREWLSLINGTADTTMVRDLAWDFIQAGKFYERSENSLRNLYSYLDEHKKQAHTYNQSNYNRLISLLRTANGYEAFRKQYADHVTLTKVIEFLLLESSFPHSLNYALSSLEIYLKQIKEQDRQFELHVKKSLMDIAHIKDALVQFEGSKKELKFLESLLKSIDNLGLEISTAFFHEEFVEL